MRQSARRERKSSSRGDGICSWFFVLLTFALGVVLLLCGMPNAAYADEDQDPAENAVRVAEDLLNSVLNRPDFQNSFVFSADRDSSYWLGEPLNTYIEANGEYSQTNLVVWPVFAGQDIVASVVEMRDLESGSTYRFSTANSEDIDAFFKKEEKGAIVLRGSSACLVSNDAEGGDVDELIDAAPLIESLGRQKACTTKCTVSYTKQVVKEPIYPCRELVARDGGGDDWFTWVEIDVPRFRQRSWNTCWATCASMVGTYMTHQYISDLTISHRIYGESHVGTAYDTILALSFFRYPKTHFAVRAVSLRGDIDQDQVGNWITNGLPIIARLTVSNSGIGHQVVVCGFASDKGHSLIKIADPASGRHELLERNDRGIALSHRLGYTWDRGTIVLAGWNKAPGRDKFAYYELDGTKR